MKALRVLAMAAVVLLVAAAGLAVWRGGLQPGGEARAAEGLSPVHILAATADADFPRVTVSRPLRFPADHGAHDEYRTESWYVAGTVDAGTRAPLGIQLLLIRIGLGPRRPEHPSPWATSGIYAGVVSVSDPVEGRGIMTGQRFSRAALGLAGAETGPVRVWVEDWRLEQLPNDGDAFDFSMQVATQSFDLDLELRNVRPLVASDALRARGSDQAAPFRFYVQPRLRGNGTLAVGQERMRVSGTFSVEHAWGELPLPGGPVASDRFTLHLEDGRILFGVRSHRVDGSGNPTATGLLVRRDGSFLVLSRADIELIPEEYWRSPRTDARYPTHWRLRVPREDIDAELTPYRADQEGLEWMPFWAGPVRLEGDSVRGDGFVQLHGYGP